MPAPDTDGPRSQSGGFWLLAFMTFIAGACLILTPLADINAAKWFTIRAIAPLLLVARLMLGWMRGRVSLAWDAIGFLGLGYLALHAVSIAVATNHGYALERTSQVFGLLAAYFLAANLCVPRRARIATLWILLFVGAATAAYGIAQHFGYDFFSWQTSARSEREVPIERGVSFFGHATFTASVLIQIIPLGVALALGSGWRGRTVAAAVTLAMLYHLSFSGARMATLAFVVSVAAAGLWWFLRARSSAAAARAPAVRRLAAGLAVLLVVAGAGGWFILRAWQVKGSDLFAVRQSSMALRFYNWETASRMVYAHPLLGIGAGNYEIVSPVYWNDVERMRTARYGRWMQQSHNDYLQTAAELGLPGVAVLLALFAYGVVMALDVAARATNRADRFIGLGLFTALAALALDANTTFSLQVPGSALVCWIVLGLISAAHRELGTGQR